MELTLREMEATALSAQKKEDYSHAAEIWRNIIERQNNWEHGYAHYYLADCYASLGRFSDAEVEYLEAIRIEPNDKLFSDALDSLRVAKKSGLIG